MKKTLGLVMALVMILTAVSAFAAVPSKTTADLVKVTTESKNVTVTATANESAAVTALLEALMENGRYKDLLLSITDDPSEAVEAILSFQG